MIESASSKLAQIDPATGAITTFSLPTAPSDPQGLTSGPDGNIWFTETGVGKVGVINLATHAITEFPLPNFTSDPSAITSGPGGKLWFVEDYAGKIGEIDPTTHAISEFAIPSSNSRPAAITAGPDGDLWFIESATGTIGSFHPSTQTFSEFPAQATTGIAPGPDGQIWFTTPTSVSEINVSSHVISNYPIPPGAGTGTSQPGSIVTGPDGNLWLGGRNKIIEAQIIPPSQAAIVSNVSFDPTGDGTFSGGPFANRLVYLDENHDGKLDPNDPTAVTDDYGNGTFSGLAPGTYTVRLHADPGDHVTFPIGNSQTITVAGGQLGQAKPIGLIPIGAVLPLTLNLSPFGSHNPDVSTAEVSGLYNIILGRAPDAAGGGAAVAALKGGTPLAQIASNLLHSPEYYTDVALADYENYLGRAPSQVETSSVVSALQGGLSFEQLAAGLLSSTEFSLVHASDTDFVQSAYRDTLGREASSAEVAGVTALIQGGLSRSGVIQSLLSSDEADVRSVDGFYFLFLARNGDQFGQTYWISAIQAGTPLVNVAIQFASSPEFQSLANATVG